MAVILLDDFNRSNSTNTVGPSPVGSVTPTSSVGTWGINGNQLYSSAVSSSRAMILWDAGTPDVDISVSRTAGPNLTSGGIVFAANSDTDGYMINFQGVTGFTLGRWSGTTYVIHSMFRTPSTYTYGQSMKVIHNDGVVELFLDNVSLGRQTLPTVPTGTKIGLYHDATSDRWDNLVVEDASNIDMEYSGFLYKGRDTASLDAGAIE